MNRGHLHATIGVLLCVTAAAVAWADTNPPRLIPTPTNEAPSAVLSTPQPIHIPTGAPDGQKLVWVIPVREDIDKPLVYIVRRGIKDAIAGGANLVVLDMNTNGGRGDAMEEIMELLDEFDGDTVTFINKKAYSAGAFISAATKHIYMAPGSVIGAAAPMMMSPGGEVEKPNDTVEKKFVSAYAAKIRAAAQKNGHNADVFEAMVNKVKGLKIDDEQIIKEGEILTLTNQEAEKEYGAPPKHLLSDGTVTDLHALLEVLGYGNAEVKRVEPTGAEQVAQWITTIAPILLLLGILGIYIEIKLQTFGVIGVLAVLCLLVYFFGHYIAGISGLEYLALFTVGVILVLVEVFAFPGTAVLGVLGSMFILISLIMAMVDRMPNTPIVPTFPQLELPLMKFGIGLAGAVVAALFMAKFLPKTALFNTFVLQTASGGTIATPTPDTKPDQLLGATGKAASPLRPAGKAMIHDKLMDVVTEGDHIPTHTQIKVIAVEGSRVVVARA